MSTPLFSIITPVYDPPPWALRAAVESVLAQTWTDWEMCIVDDASRAPEVAAVLEEAARDPRVKVARRARNGGIVAASNDAIRMAGGEHLALLDHDDLLHPDALEAVAGALAADVDYVYTDEDKVDAQGRHFGAFLKPHWSPERLRTQMYTCHLSVLRRSLVDEVGGFRAEFEGSQDWDLVLRVTERARRVEHVPRVLYSWRALPSSAAGAGVSAKPYAYLAGARALQAHCDRIGFEAEVAHDPDPSRSSVYHLQPALSAGASVSIIIPTCGATREVRGQPTTLVSHCVRSIFSQTQTAPDTTYEVVVVAGATTPESTLDELQAIGESRLTIVPYDRPFSFSEKINLGACHAAGDHLLLLNDDTEVITPQWLSRLLMYSRHAPIGAVGCRLVFEDGRLQHAGIVCDDEGPHNLHRCYPPGYRGYSDNVLVAGNYLAVTGACLMTRREVFEEVGGLSFDLPINYNDVDYGLKVWQAGYRVAYDPDTVLYHFESSTREAGVAAWELEGIKNRWRHRIARDPFVPIANAGPGNAIVPPVQFGSGALARPGAAAAAPMT